MLLVPRRKLLRLGAAAAAAPLITAPYVLRRAMADDFNLGVGTKKGTGGIAPTAFDPSKLVGQYGSFYRADVGVTQSSGNVSGWADQGVNGINLVLSQGQPFWSATRFNTSHPGIGFGTQSGFGTATNDALVALGNNRLWSTTFSLFVGLTVGSTLVSGSMLFRLSMGLVGQYWWDFGTGAQFNAHKGGFFTPGELGNPSAISITTGSPQMLGWIANGSTCSYYKDQTAQGTPLPHTHTLGSVGVGISEIEIGQNGAGPPPNMVVAWFLWTSRALSATDISNVASWSNTNFGTSF